MWQLSECIDGMAEACRALVAAGHRRQRQPLQRERRGRHRPHAGARPARPGRRAARAAARVWPGRRATPWCCSAPGPRRTGPSPWTGPAGPPSAGSTAPGRCPPLDLAAPRAPCAPSWPGWSSAIVAGDHEPAAGQRRARCVLGRPGRGPGRDGGGRRHRLRASTLEDRGRAVHRAALALRGGHHHARRAVSPGPSASASRLSCSGGPGATASRLGELVDLPLTALRAGPRGQPGPPAGGSVRARPCARMGAP